MINFAELRIGNYILHKTGVRILPFRCSFQHFELNEKGQAKDMFPVVLKADILEKAGFTETRKYALLPEAKEFVMALPVIGNSENEIRAYIKNNKECFARATLNNLPISNNIYNLHQLQNLYYALTGKELDVTL
jgi:hypothetical protein